MSTRRVTPPEIAATLIIVGLLLALFWPGFQKPSHHRRDWVTCLSSLKQIGLALHQYPEDNDDRPPLVADAPAGRITWRAAIEPYTKNASLVHCPARSEGAVGADGLASDYAASASPNGAFAPAGAKPRALTSLFAPAKMIVIVEATGTNRAGFDIDGTADLNHLWAGHWGRSNYVLADGHVKYLHPLDTYRVDASARVIQNEWYRDGKKPLSANGQELLRQAQAEFSR